MQLRQKFGLLVLVYVLSLSANLVMSGWCIIVYFQSAFVDFESDFTHEQKIERLRMLERQARDLPERRAAPLQLLAEYEACHTEFWSTLAELKRGLAGRPLTPPWTEIEDAATRACDAVRRRLEQIASPAPESVRPASLSAADEDAFVDLDRRLGVLARALVEDRQSDVMRVANVQDRVVRILILNTACGAVLCVLGVVFVTRWVIRPVAALREAARQIGSGNLSHRTPIRSRDELGKLAGEVNQMAATILEMQTRLVERERLAAAGEMFTRVAHNIRNPLAGMRGLAEATAERHPDHPETVECQTRIIDTIDRFEKWLRDVQQAVSPMTLKLQPVHPVDLIANVTTVLRPMADRRRVKVQVQVAPAATRVRMDPAHMEQALVALLTNAIQASAPGQSVRVWVRPAPEGEKAWQLAIEDDGAGIPPEIQETIFLPYFTTKPDGNGLGLAIASKVIRTHGGRLTVESEPGRGSRFLALLPGLIGEPD